MDSPKGLSLVLVVLMPAMLTACMKDLGNNAPDNSPIQGYYQGNTSKSKTSDVVILEDGSFWQIYGNTSGNTYTVQGVITGSTTTSNSNFTLTAKDFPAPGISPVTASGGGSYTGTTLLGSINENGQTITLNAVIPIPATFNYNSNANLSSITGLWIGPLLNGEYQTIDIAANGTLSGTSTSGCMISGLVKPRPGGKNVFDISLTMGSSPCPLPNQVMTGIALTYPTGSYTNRLIAGLVPSSQSMALTFNAER